MKLFLNLFAIIFLPTSVFAAPIRPLLGLGLGFGGDSVVKAYYQNGTESEIKAGDGVSFYGGAVTRLWQQSEHLIDLQATLGYKFKSTKAATNGEFSFSKVPVDILGLYRHKQYKFRGGVGITYHLGNKFSGTGVVSNYTADVDNALGFVLQGDYLLGFLENMAIGLRFESIKYTFKAPSFPAQDLKGDNIGFYFQYVFGSDEASS
ncbi:MAG: hypothetical protein KDD33_06370 [Bdellovibrionales bacterium]|nr:hypothetical protein [Bdellovibrionales bacterium]